MSKPVGDAPAILSTSVTETVSQFHFRHSGQAKRDPESRNIKEFWIPAFAGMTTFYYSDTVSTAEVDIKLVYWNTYELWHHLKDNHPLPPPAGDMMLEYTILKHHLKQRTFNSGRLDLPLQQAYTSSR